MSATVIPFPQPQASPDVTESELVAMLQKYVELAKQGRLRSVAIISASDRWRHGLEMLVEDEDAVDFIGTFEFAKARCIAKAERDADE